MQKCIKIFFTLGGGPPDWLLTEKFSIKGVGGGVNPMMENSIMFLLFFDINKNFIYEEFQTFLILPLLIEVK